MCFTNLQKIIFSLKRKKNRTYDCIFSKPETKYKDSFSFFISYLALGAYFVSLSPYILEKFGNQAKYIFLSGQMGYPMGYFFAGWISDQTKRIKIYSLIFSLLLFPSQYYLYSPESGFWMSFLLSGAVRFLFASQMQILQIAALESLDFQGFSISRAGGTFGFLVMQITMFLLESFFLNSDVNYLIQGSRGGQYSAIIHLISFIIAFKVLPNKRISENPFYFKKVINIIYKFDLYYFFIVSFFYYFAYQIVDFYLGRYFLQLGGMRYVYLSWIIAVIIDFFFFFFSEIIIHRWGLKFIFLFSLLMGTIRFFLLLVNSFLWGGIWILLSQILHGIHFTGYMAGIVYFFHKKFPSELYGTAFGIFIIFSLSMGSITGNLIYGKILFQFQNGFPAIFFITFLIHLILWFVFFKNKKIDSLLNRERFENNEKQIF